MIQFLIFGLIGDFVMWIKKEDEKYYTDCSKLKGLRVTFDRRISGDRIKEIKKFAIWLRKKYYFPIRCNVHISFCSYFKKINSMDVDSVIDFYYQDDTIPSIKIAGYPNRKNKDKNYYIQIQARMVYALTFYYQWFFYEFDKRSDRSLKIEATKWQNYIMDDYLRVNE